MSKSKNQLINEVSQLKSKILGFEVFQKNILSVLKADKTSKEKLLDSINLFNSVFYNNPIPTYITSIPEEVFVEVNPMFENISGYNKDELLGRTALELGFYHNSEDRERLLEELKKVGRLFDYEIIFNVKSGDSRFCRIFSETIQFRGQQHLLSMVYDETERKITENKLLESNKIFSELTKMLPELVFMTDEKLNITYANQSAFDILGYTQEDIEKGLNGLDILIPEERERARVYFEMREEGLEPGTQEYLAQKKDGTVFPVLFHAKTIFKNGKLSGLIGTIFDISNIKKTEWDLKKSEERYRRIIEDQTEFIVRWKPGGIRTFVNDSYCKYFGLTKDEAIGTSFLEQISEPDKELIYQKIGKLGPHCPVLANVHRVVRKDGTEGWNEWTDRALINEKGEIFEYQSVGRDITERKKAEEELILAKERAEESDRLKTAFLANLSHEIRTPLNGILGFLYVLESGELSKKEQKNYFDIIRKSGDRLINTINDILEIAMIQSGVVKVKRERINIKDTFLFLESFFIRDVEEKGLKLSFECNLNKEILEFETDKTKFESVLINLIKNAIKFTNQGGIQCTCDNHPDGLVFKIQDTGIGIERTRIHAIFDRFVQADLRITRGHEGSGLGLSIVKAYVEFLGGKIWVKSKRGEGSTFSFSLPYKAPKTNNVSLQP